MRELFSFLKEFNFSFEDVLGVSILEFNLFYTLNLFGCFVDCLVDSVVAFGDESGDLELLVELAVTLNVY